MILDTSEVVQIDLPKYFYKACQVEITVECEKPGKSFTCNRYIVQGISHSEVEIQTEITEDTRVVIVPSQKKFKDKMCGTELKTYTDQSVGPDTQDEMRTPIHQ